LVLFARLASYSELGKFLPDDHAKFAPNSSSEMGLLEAKKSLTLVTQAPASWITYSEDVPNKRAARVHERMISNSSGWMQISHQHLAEKKNGSAFIDWTSLQSQTTCLYFIWQQTVSRWGFPNYLALIREFLRHVTKSSHRIACYIKQLQVFIRTINKTLQIHNWKQSELFIQKKEQ
jgi:hypothetical protein